MNRLRRQPRLRRLQNGLEVRGKRANRFPDAAVGYAFLSANGGHPDSPERSVIRRWTAPRDGILNTLAALAWESERRRGACSSAGFDGRHRGNWTALNGTVDTSLRTSLFEPAIW